MAPSTTAALLEATGRVMDSLLVGSTGAGAGPGLLGMLAEPGAGVPQPMP
jgi:hypothetical protein